VKGSKVGKDKQLKAVKLGSGFIKDKNVKDYVSGGVKIAEGRGAVNSVIVGSIFSMVFLSIVLILLMVNMLVGTTKLEMGTFTNEDATAIVTEWNTEQDSIEFEVGQDQIIYGRYDFGDGDILDIGKEFQKLTAEEQSKKVQNVSKLVEIYGKEVPCLILTTVDKDKVLIVKDGAVYYNFFEDIKE
jgi:hypothetical protein